MFFLFIFQSFFLVPFLCPSSCLCFFASCAPVRVFAFLVSTISAYRCCRTLVSVGGRYVGQEQQEGQPQTIITSLSVRGAVWSESVVCRPGWGLECVSVMAAKSRLNAAAAAVLLSCTSAEEAGRSKFTTTTAKPIISTTESSPAYT